MAHRLEKIPENKLHVVRAMEHEVARLKALDLYYGRGGGRNCGPLPCTHADYTENDIAGDCSWLTLRLCAVAHFPIKDWLGYTGTLAGEGEAGEGWLFTMHIKDPYEHEGEGHVINEFHHPDRHRWAECGGSDNPSDRGGPNWFEPTAERIAEFPVKRHFKGF